MTTAILAMVAGLMLLSVMSSSCFDSNVVVFYGHRSRVGRTKIPRAYPRLRLHGVFAGK